MIERIPGSLKIAFGNQTISANEQLERPSFTETHGFASLPRGKFALIVCNRDLIKELCCRLGHPATTGKSIKHDWLMFVNKSLRRPRSRKKPAGESHQTPVRVARCRRSGHLVFSVFRIRRGEIKIVLDTPSECRPSCTAASKQRRVPRPESLQNIFQPSR